MHREIMNVWDPNIFIDHINHITLDNQRSNLREVTRSENMKNSNVMKHNKSSIYKGVYHRIAICRGITYHYYNPSIYVDGKRIHLGGFPYTPEGEIEAAKVYNEAAIKYYGEYAKLNKIIK